MPYHLTFNEVFPDTTLNTSTWNVRQGFYHNKSFTTDSQDKPSALAVNDGLTIKTWSNGTRFYSGGMSSNQTFQYGYFEANISIPTAAAGMHCTFYLNSYLNLNYPQALGNNIPAITGAEVDIFEYRAVNQQNADISNSWSIDSHWNGYSNPCGNPPCS